METRHSCRRTARGAALAVPVLGGVAERAHIAQGVAVPILLLDSADNIFAPKSNADLLGIGAEQSSFTAANPAVGSTGLFSLDALHSPQPYVPFPWEGTNIGLFNVNDFGSTPGVLFLTAVFESDIPCLLRFVAR